MLAGLFNNKGNKRECLVQEPNWLTGCTDSTFLMRSCLGDCGAASQFKVFVVHHLGGSRDTLVCGSPSFLCAHFYKKLMWSSASRKFHNFKFLM